MKHSEKGFGTVTVVLIVIIVAAISGAGAYILGRNSIDSTDTTQQQTNESTNNEADRQVQEGWTEYINEEAGIKYAVPADWESKESESMLERENVQTSFYGMSFTSPEFREEPAGIGGNQVAAGARLQVFASQTSASNLTEVNRGQLIGSEHTSFDPTSTAIAGIDAYEYEFEYEGDGLYRVEFLNDGNLIEFWFDGETFDETESEIYDTFRQVLGTINLL